MLKGLRLDEGDDLSTKYMRTDIFIGVCFFRTDGDDLTGPFANVLNGHFSGRLGGETR